MRGIPAVLPVLFVCIILFIILPVSAAVYMYNGTGGTVQDLINSSASGDSIFLPSGIYRGNLIIDHTIVFGAQDTAGLPEIVTADGPAEIVTADGPAGIVLAADGITLNGLNISGTAQAGLVVQSSNNRISDITVQGLSRGIELKNAADNIFSGNTLTGNSVGITVDRASRSNTFFLNRFENTIDVAGQSAGNLWSSVRQDYSYNGSSFSGPLGNFWRVYSGTDNDSNGVGDTAYPVLDAASVPSGTTELSDRAPLISPPGSYMLLVKTTSPLNTSGTGNLPNPPVLLNGIQQLQPPGLNQNPAVSEILGGQAQFPGNSPSFISARTGTPPPGGFPGILFEFWWVIIIVVFLSVVGGIWFERSRRNIPIPAPDSYVHAGTAANATIVRTPGAAEEVVSGDWKDQPHYAAYLPPGLVKKYPDAEYMGEGGVGRVFRAWDQDEHRLVAVKIPIRFDEVTGTQFTKELHI